jgi:SnoaL-like domain
VGPHGKTTYLQEARPLVTEVLERLRDAQNAHDLDAFVACFDPQYRSEQPVHPGRAFVGSEQARKN